MARNEAVVAFGPHISLKVSKFNINAHSALHLCSPHISLKVSKFEYESKVIELAIGPHISLKVSKSSNEGGGRHILQQSPYILEGI